MDEDKVKYLQATAIIASVFPSEVSPDMRYELAGDVLNEVLRVLEINLNVGD